MGARQVGKSTLCRAIAAERGMAYRTLDDDDVRQQAASDPQGLLDELGSGGVVLDEVQRAPKLLLAIKSVVDRDERVGRYLLTGSNQPTVSKATAESLQGRLAYRTLRPLTLGELRYDETDRGWDVLLAPEDATVFAALEERAAASGRLQWVDVARTGGFPRVVAIQPGDRLQMLDQYVQTFVRRDVRDVLGIESVERFDSFFRLTAARTAQELNLSGLSRDLGTPVNTVRRWVDALVRSFIVDLVPPYSRNAGQRVVKAPKLFMVDVALALAAAREREPTGFHLETLVANDLLAWRDGGPGRAVYHWRLGSGQEVDFVLEFDSTLLPVEIKAATRVDAGDARHLRRFRSIHRNAVRGLLLSNDPEIRVLGDGIVAAPWWAVL